MSNELELLRESIKTNISAPSNLYDAAGQWVPPGNYYFLINYAGPYHFKGELNCRGFKAEYTFTSKDVIQMMAIAQARLARRANITDDAMPSYSSPIASPINNYPTLLVGNNYSNLQPPHTSPTFRQHRRRLPSTANQRPICTICLDVLNDSPKVLSCSHKFHLSCITRWYNNRQTCPVCRQRFTLRRAPISSRRTSRYTVIQRQLPQRERIIPNTRQHRRRRIQRSGRNQTSLPSLIS